MPQLNAAFMPPIKFADVDLRILTDSRFKSGGTVDASESSMPQLIAAFVPLIKFADVDLRISTDT